MAKSHIQQGKSKHIHKYCISILDAGEPRRCCICLRKEDYRTFRRDWYAQVVAEKLANVLKANIIGI